MRLPQFTTRRLMVLVAVVAVSLCGARLWSRSVEYERRAAKHAAAAARLLAWQIFPEEDDQGMRQMGEHAWRLGRYHATLKQTYERAARYPWLPVPPDPPPPD